MSDQLLPLFGNPSQLIVVTNKRLPRIVGLVFLLKVDEGPHAGIEQRLNPLAVTCRIWSTWIRPCEQQTINDPVGAVTRCRANWVDETGGNIQAKTPMKQR